jgi:hypothetical protein
MAFDVYVGTFTRFHTRDWENVVQRQARIDGIEYRTVYTDGDPGPPPPASEVRAVVEAWRNALNRSMTGQGFEPLVWSEDDGQEYFTDRPGWEGYSALLLWAAYAQFPDARPPQALPEDIAMDPIYQKVMADDTSQKFPTLLSASLWLPGDFRFCFDAPSLIEDEEVMITSCGGLLDQLRKLKTMEPRWSEPSLMNRIRSKSRGVSLQEAAQLGMRVFTELAEKAVEHRLPIMLSY